MTSASTEIAIRCKITEHAQREIAARPELVQIETAFRNPKERQPDALSRNEYTEVDLTEDENEIPAAPSTIPAVSFPSTPTPRRDRSNMRRTDLSQAGNKAARRNLRPHPQ